MDTQVSDKIFESGDIIITRTLAIFGSTTYAINGIGSVYIGQKRNKNILWAGAIAAVVTILAYFGGYQEGAMIAAIIAVIAFIAYFARPQFLVLSISSGDKEAYKSGNYEVLEEIKQAIESAITLRG